MGSLPSLAAKGQQQSKSIEEDAGTVEESKCLIGHQGGQSQFHHTFASVLRQVHTSSPNQTARTAKGEEPLKCQLLKKKPQTTTTD